MAPAFGTSIKGPALGASMRGPALAEGWAFVGGVVSSVAFFKMDLGSSALASSETGGGGAAVIELQACLSFCNSL
jgi:hypothetical protein